MPGPRVLGTRRISAAGLAKLEPWATVELWPGSQPPTAGAAAPTGRPLRERVVPADRPDRPGRLRRARHRVWLYARCTDPGHRRFHLRAHRMAEMAADNLLAGLRGNPLPYPILVPGL